MVIFGNHFFECSFRLIHVCSGGEFVSVVDAANDEFLIHSYGEDGISLLEFFVPFVVGI